MRQRDLECAVARSTGESLGTVRRLGFSLASPPHTGFDPEPCGPGVVDWDEVELERNVSLLEPRPRRCAA